MNVYFYVDFDGYVYKKVIGDPLGRATIVHREELINFLKSKKEPEIFI